MLARAIQLGQFVMDAGPRRFRLRRAVGGVEGQGGRTGEGRTHQRNRTEHIGTHQGRPSRHGSSEIMPCNHCDLAMAERRYEAQRIPDRIQNAKRAEIAVVIRVPPGCAAIAPLVGRDDAIAGGRQRRHDLSPGIS
jgi:hypothetical protein